MRDADTVHRTAMADLTSHGVWAIPPASPPTDEAACRFFKTNVIRYHAVGAMANGQIFFKLSGEASMKHLGDTSGMKNQMHRPDTGCADRWAAQPGIHEEWEFVSENAAQDGPPRQTEDLP
ncbi:MAG: hypothetical protein ACKO9Z_11315 [Planctomycetota bacterium]